MSEPDDWSDIAAHLREQDRDTPGRAWDAAPYQRGRGNICRALRIDRSDPLASFATAAFHVLDVDDRAWIAGAVGAPPSLNAKAVATWRHTDVSDVILWDPAANDLRVVGEPADTAVLIAPHARVDRLTVYADGYSFFRAWADARAEIAASILAARKSLHVLIPPEPGDGGLPGALAIGPLERLPWGRLDATILVAGPGIDPATLNRAIFRSAQLPRVEAWPDQPRRAA